MNIRLNILVVFVLWALAGCAPENSPSNSVKLLALGCQLTLPQGYVISTTETGPIRGQFVGSKMNSAQFFEYYPNKTWAEVSTNFEQSIHTLQANQLGEIVHLVVEYRPMNKSGSILEYHVFFNQTEYLGTPVSAKTNFAEQFAACAST
jgi:hypothetical protein